VAHFSIGIGRSGGTVVITIHGLSSHEDWARIDAVLRDIIDAQGNLDVVLDLGDVASLEHDAAPLIVYASGPTATAGASGWPTAPAGTGAW
jgi:hypothetical protein